jgi:hypothetical protein
MNLKKKSVRLRNQDLADEAIEAITREGRTQLGSGRFVAFHGPAGTGKSFSARSISERTGAPLIVARMTYTPRSMLGDILHAILGWHVDGRIEELYGRIIELLHDRREMTYLLVDEADCLNQSPRYVLLNVLRGIADTCGLTICLFSTDALTHRFAVPTPYLEQLTSRLGGHHVQFERPGIRDAAKLAELIEGVRLERDLVTFCLAGARGSLRPLIDLYGQIEGAAKAGGIAGDLNLNRALRLGIVTSAAERPETISGASSDSSDRGERQHRAGPALKAEVA